MDEQTTEYAGPDDFSDYIINSREQFSNCSGLSDAGIRGIVRLLYGASLLPEEGLYNSYRFYCEWAQPQSHEPSFCPFDRHIELKTPYDIKKLAPVGGYDGAIFQFIEHNNKFKCIGYHTESTLQTFGLTLGKTIYPSAQKISSTGVTFTVLGPGHICVNGLPGYWQLKGGCITKISPWPHANPVRKWIEDVSGVVELMDNIGQMPPYTNYQMTGAISGWLSQVTEYMTSMRRGGTVIIANTGEPSLSTALDNRYPINMDIREDFQAIAKSINDIDNNIQSESANRLLIARKLGLLHKARAGADD